MQKELKVLYDRARESNVRQDSEEEKGVFLHEYIAVADLTPLLRKVIGMTRSSERSWATVEFSHFTPNIPSKKGTYSISVEWTINTGGRDSHGVNKVILSLEDQSEGKLKIVAHAFDTDIIRAKRANFDIDAALSGKDNEALASLDPDMAEEYWKVEGFLDNDDVKEELLAEMISLFIRPDFAEDGSTPSQVHGNSGQ